MELKEILTMILVIGLVWGGLGFFLSRAIKCEKLKNSKDDAG